MYHRLANKLAKTTEMLMEHCYTLGKDLYYSLRNAFDLMVKDIFQTKILWKHYFSHQKCTILVILGYSIKINCSEISCLMSLDKNINLQPFKKCHGCREQWCCYWAQYYFTYTFDDVFKSMLVTVLEDESINNLISW